MVQNQNLKRDAFECARCNRSTLNRETTSNTAREADKRHAFVLDGLLCQLWR